MSSKISEKSGFCVPHDDVESLSDESDAGSCQLLHSHPRTFSVPSSGDEAQDSDDDDDDVIIPTSKRSFLASVNSRDTREPHSARSNSCANNTYAESHNQSQQAPSRPLTGSQRSRTSSQGDPPGSDNFLHNESEDEGPEVIHSGQGQQHDLGARSINTEDAADTTMMISEIPDTYPRCVPHLMKAQISRTGDNGYDHHGNEGPLTLQDPAIYPNSSHNDSSPNFDRDATEANIQSRTSFHQSSGVPNGQHIIFAQSKPSMEYGFNDPWQPTGTKEHWDNVDKHGDHAGIKGATDGAQFPTYTNEQNGSCVVEGTSVQAKSSRGHISYDDSQQDDDLDTSQNLCRESSVFSIEIDNKGQRSPALAASSHLPSESTTPFDHGRCKAADHQSACSPMLKDRPSSPDLSEAPSAPLDANWQPTTTTSHESLSSTRRAPSPSDAALARKAMLGRAENPTLPVTADDNGVVYGAASDPTDYLRYATFHRLNHSLPQESEHGLPPAKFFGDLRSDPSMSKHRSSLASLLAQASDDWQNGQADGLDNRGRVDIQGDLDYRRFRDLDYRRYSGTQPPKPGEYQQDPSSIDLKSSDSVTEPLQAGRWPINPPPQKQCVVKLKLDQNSTGKYSDDSSSKQQVFPNGQNAGHAKSSKVDISNLVHSHGEGLRGKKRKSDQMSTEKPPSTATGLNSSLLTISTTPQYETASGVRTCGSGKEKDRSFSQELLQRLDQPVTKTVEEGPARKKLKPTASKASTISKFVSGVCLGIGAAFAAFVATTPAEVWEEALREASKLR